jgi:hypothetical protein
MEKNMMRGWVLIFQDIEVSQLVDISTLMMKAPNRTSNPCHHYTTASLVINLCAYELTSPRRLTLISAMENTSKNKEEAIGIADE